MRKRLYWSDSKSPLNVSGGLFHLPAVLFGFSFGIAFSGLFVLNRRIFGSFSYIFHFFSLCNGCSFRFNRRYLLSSHITVLLADLQLGNRQERFLFRQVLLLQQEQLLFQWILLLQQLPFLCQRSFLL